MRAILRRLALAIQFLTILRLRVADPVTDEEVRGATYFFPMVGLGIGALLAGAAWGLHQLVVWPVAAAVLVVALVILTGGLHLDGLADMCDGFYAGRTREERLQIMKDPHIGTMGVIGLICLLGLKYICLANTPWPRVLGGLLVAPVISRAAMVIACRFGKYAREKGTAKVFIGQLQNDHLVCSVALAILACGLLGWPHGAIMPILLLIWILLFIPFCNRRIGGLTGDTVGALNETTELLVWLMMVC